MMRPTAGEGTAPAPATTHPGWGRLLARARSVSPQSVARGALVLAVAGAGLWLAGATWPAMLPFAIGALIAYTVLPLVNALDGILPRTIASLVAVFLLLATVIAVFVVVLPPLARTVGALVTELPTRSEVDAWIASLQASAGELPGGAGPRLAALIDGIVVAIRDNIDASATGIGDLVPTILQGVVGAVAAALGLVVLPTWMLSVLRDQRRARGTVLTAFPSAARADALAVIRIVDRAASFFLRGQIPRAFLVGGLVWLGLEGVDRLGLVTFRESGAIAVLAGAVQVIPEIGGLLGFIPALLILPLSPERAAVYTGAYVVSRMVAGGLVSQRDRRRRKLHPIVMVPALVALSNFGLIWLLIAGPILAAGYDLVRYAHGRLSEPARPAGLIPDEEPAPLSAPARRVRRSLPSRRVEVTTGG